MKQELTVVLFLILFASCGAEKIEKKPIFYAEREAPIGLVTLKAYPDSSFEFTYSALRDQEVYPGTYSIRNDTISFIYSDSVPNVNRTKAIIKNGRLTYLDTIYKESLDISLNQLQRK